MNYLLVVIADSRRDLTERTLRSFFANVRPRPAAAFIHLDGLDVAPAALLTGLQWTAESDITSIGFTRSVTKAWQRAGRGDYEWVYWLECDFLHLAPLDLRDLRDVLDSEPQLRQLILKRQAIGEEVTYGGYVQQYRSQYRQRETLGFPWIETIRNWSMNPGLFRARLAAEHPWPEVPNSEAAFGSYLRQQDPHSIFGIWGAIDAPPRCFHIGDNRAPGSFGY